MGVYSYYCYIAPIVLVLSQVLGYDGGNDTVTGRKPNLASFECVGEFVSVESPVILEVRTRSGQWCGERCGAEAR